MRRQTATAGQEVLADRVRRQIEAELGDLAGNIGREGIAVRAGPGTILMRIGIAADRGTDILDHCVDTWPAPVEDDLWFGAEPVIVRTRPVDANRRGAVGDTKAKHLVPRITLGPGRLDRMMFPSEQQG